TGLHVHSSESIWEVQESLRRYGHRPIEELFDRGLLGERTVVAHAVWLDDREIRILAETDTSVVHCPCSNMKLASGAARVGALRALHTTPLLHGADSNVAAHLVFSASGHDVDQVWVDGRLLVDGGSIISVDATAIRARAQVAAEELFARRAAAIHN